MGETLINLSTATYGLQTDPVIAIIGWGPEWQSGEREDLKASGFFYKSLDLV